jgi:hypothetical protein
MDGQTHGRTDRLMDRQTKRYDGLGEKDFIRNCYFRADAQNVYQDLLNIFFTDFTDSSGDKRIDEMPSFNAKPATKTRMHTS